MALGQIYEYIIVTENSSRKNRKLRHNVFDVYVYPKVFPVHRVVLGDSILFILCYLLASLFYVCLRIFLKQIIL